jgi:hypothetical protein
LSKKQWLYRSFAFSALKSSMVLFTCQGRTPLGNHIKTQGSSGEREPARACYGTDKIKHLQSPLVFVLLLLSGQDGLRCMSFIAISTFTSQHPFSLFPLHLCGIVVTGGGVPLHSPYTL